MTKEIRYLSTFSGLGGQDLGLELAAQTLGIKATCVGFSEVDSFASSVYSRHFQGRTAYGDIKTLQGKDIPDFDLLLASPPCQDVSICGKRAGLQGERSGLFFEFARLLREKQPTCFVMENVKGLLSSNGGKDFEQVFTTFDGLGYNVQTEVLDAQYFGSPQHRERVVCIGFLRARCPREVLSIKGTSEKTAFATDCIISPAKRRTKAVKHNYINTIVASYKGISGDGNPGLIEGDRIRRLTPIECERAQMLPDGWTKWGKDGELISDTQRYKLCGNAVCVSVFQAVYMAIFKSSFADTLSDMN